jgi:hypothetical protein
MLFTGEAVCIIGIGIRSCLYSRVLVRVDALAKMYGVLQLLPEDIFAGITRHLEQEEARVALRKKVVGGIVFVHHLHSTTNRLYRVFILMILFFHWPSLISG